MNFEHLSQDQHDRIINASLEFMAAITDAFGPEVGIVKWEGIAGCVGDNFKHEMFIAMLAGKTANKINLRWRHINDTGNQYVEFIKKLRMATGWGLKEAKDFADILKSSGTAKAIEVKSEHRQALIDDFRNITYLEAF